MYSDYENYYYTEFKIFQKSTWLCSVSFGIKGKDKRVSVCACVCVCVSVLFLVNVLN